jgi:hypothetical protein
MKRRKPIASEWRLGLDAPDGRRIRIRSHNYPNYTHYHEEFNERRTERETVDEFVLILGDECIHIERMDHRTFFVGLGEEKRMITVGKDGKIKVGEMYK